MANEFDSALDVSLQPLTRFNWEAVANLQVAEEQAEYIPSNLYSIAQSRFEPIEPFGIYADEEPVGFLAMGKWSDVHWITRVMIDARFQGKGYGKAALNAALQNLKNKTGVDEVRTSIAHPNALAEYLFYSAGFRRAGRLDSKEFLMKFYFKPD